VTFGIFDGSTRTITSAVGKNNGQWHHVVGTFEPGSMKLYLDGALIGTQAVAGAVPYTGHWRIGIDNLSGWPSRPTDAGLAGTVDEVAVYAQVLDQTQVLDHFQHR
jgi:hypothetical protein